MINRQNCPIILKDITSLDLSLAPWREDKEKIALVPTMGSLHEGHLSLIRLAKEHAHHVVVSIFVNPRQFGPSEDFATYPRDEQADIEKIAQAGADVAYIPEVEVMYPPGYQTNISLPHSSQCLDGLSRPGFFDGIATVVAKLLLQVRPDIAVFGEKDFQQLLIIRQMVRDLHLPVDIVGAPIVREEDGFAMSSRNQYLSAEERAIAGQLNQVMRQSLVALQKGTAIKTVLQTGKEALKKAGLTNIDYFELRSVPDLRPLTTGKLSPEAAETARLFAAVMLGKTRLIDNMKVA